MGGELIKMVVAVLGLGGGDRHEEGVRDGLFRQFLRVPADLGGVLP